VNKVRQGHPKSAGDIRVGLKKRNRPWQLNEVAFVKTRTPGVAGGGLDCFLSEESGLIPETIEGSLFIDDTKAVSPH
jgi:hypothetical protein